jgi:putative transposase
MIASNVVYVDFHAAPLAEPSKVTVLVSPEAAARNVGNQGIRKTNSYSVVDLHCGITVTWDGRVWNIVNMGQTSVGLLSEDQRLTELPKTAVESLIQGNRIEVACSDVNNGSEPAMHERLSQAREIDLRVANQRSQLVHYYLQSGKLPAETGVTTRPFTAGLLGIGKRRWGVLAAISA